MNYSPLPWPCSQPQTAKLWPDPKGQQPQQWLTVEALTVSGLKKRADSLPESQRIEFWRSIQRAADRYQPRTNGEFQKGPVLLK